jgi:sugar phosphate isomerase/epimerase
MKLACSTVSFPVPLPEALLEVFRLGFSHADLIGIPGYRQAYPEMMARDPEGQARLIGNALARARISPATFNVNVPPFPDRTETAREQRRAEWHGLAKVMKSLGMGVASFYPGYLKQGEPWHEVLDSVAATTAEMLVAASSLGVEFVLEAHYDTPVCSPEQVRGLLSHLPSLRFAYDPSHFAMLGVSPGETLSVLDRSSHVHIRDAAPGRMHVKCGTGTVDLPWLISALKERKYTGFISLECLPDAQWSLDEDILCLKKLLENLA